MRILVAIGTAALLLSGCATLPPPQPATLTFAGSNCTGQPDLTRAVSLVPDKERAIHSVTVQIGSATPCVMQDGHGASYALFAIPSDFEDKTLTVGGLLEPLRILSPAVAVLDSDGQVSRQFRPDEFLYRGPSYSVLFRPRADERYVLVTTDPSRVGQTYDAINIGVNTSAVYTGLGTAYISTGVDGAQSRVFSHEGAAQVVVNDSDTKEEGAATPTS